MTSSTGDLVAGNNAAATTSNVFARADLAVTQSGAPAAICTGQPITYTLNVSNAGPSTATSVSVSDALPAGAGFVSASGSGWSCSGTSTVTCTRASLPTGAAPAITISITAPGTAGTATNSVTVSSATNDPAAGNNLATASTTVNAVPTTPVASNNGPVCAGATLQLSTASGRGSNVQLDGPQRLHVLAPEPDDPGRDAGGDRPLQRHGHHQLVHVHRRDDDGDGPRPADGDGLGRRGDLRGRRDARSRPR